MKAAQRSHLKATLACVMIRRSCKLRTLHIPHRQLYSHGVFSRKLGWLAYESGNFEGCSETCEPFISIE